MKLKKLRSFNVSNVTRPRRLHTASVRGGFIINGFKAVLLRPVPDLWGLDMIAHMQWYMVYTRIIKKNLTDEIFRVCLDIDF